MPVEGRTSHGTARGLGRRGFILIPRAPRCWLGAATTAARAPAVAQRGANRTLLKGGVVLSFDRSGRRFREGRRADRRQEDRGGPAQHRRRRPGDRRVAHGGAAGFHRHPPSFLSKRSCETFSPTVYWPITFATFRAPPPITTASRTPISAIASARCVRSMPASPRSPTCRRSPIRRSIAMRWSRGLRIPASGQSTPIHAAPGPVQNILTMSSGCKSSTSPRTTSW